MIAVSVCLSVTRLNSASLYSVIQYSLCQIILAFGLLLVYAYIFVIDMQRVKSTNYLT